MKPPVLTKQDMYRRWMAGEFGNAIKCWMSVDEFERDLAAGEWPKERRVALRYSGPAGGSPICDYDIHPSDVRRRGEELCALHKAEFSRLVVNDSDDEGNGRTIQGEVCRIGGPWFLRFTQHHAKMREAFKHDERVARGLEAKLLLDHYMDPNAREWLDHLMETYPDHVVEFTCLNNPCGTHGWNTIFWECRYY